MKKQFILGITLTLFSTLLFAHPGHGFVSAYAGFFHPFSGWDHLLVMIAVGAWAARIGGKARWILPLTFLSAMSVGTLLGYAGVYISGIETAIAASILAMGVLLLIHLPIKLSTQAGLTMLFALLHGMAHGAELTAINQVAVIGGMLLATAILHGFGFVIGLQKHKFLEKLNGAFPYVLIAAGMIAIS